MIEFQQLELEDFGPYRGIHTFDFGSSSGVWIVYGSNGRGKTSLLNAFRYALYGEIEGRIGKIEPAEMVNTLTRKEAGGVGRMRVTLSMVVDGDEEWEVTRVYDEEEDSPVQLLVSINNNLRSAAQGQRELENLLPPELSDFFLFDAEDLKNYEYLLEEDSEAANKLRNAIERVLGIPTLRQAATALGEVNSEATKVVATHMKRNELTREAGEALEEAQELLDQHRKSRQEEFQDKAEREQELDEVEEKLRQHERSESIMVKLDTLREVAGEIGDELDEAEEELAEVTPELWKLVLKEPSEKRIELLEGEEEALHKKAQMSGFTLEVRERLEEDPTECPVCSTRVSEKEVDRILASLPAAQRGADAVAEDIGELRRKKAALTSPNFRAPDPM